jgi:hypothetical protein
MITRSENIRLSATDLSNHLACNHLTSLDLSVARGDKSAPSWRKSPLFRAGPREVVDFTK